MKMEMRYLNSMVKKIQVKVYILPNSRKIDIISKYYLGIQILSLILMKKINNIFEEIWSNIKKKKKSKEYIYLKISIL